MYCFFVCLFILALLSTVCLVQLVNSLTLYLCDQKFALGVIGTSLDKYKNKVCKNGLEKQPFLAYHNRVMLKYLMTIKTC